MGETRSREPSAASPEVIVRRAGAGRAQPTQQGSGVVCWKLVTAASRRNRSTLWAILARKRSAHCRE
jgi:hypothetical protein